MKPFFIFLSITLFSVSVNAQLYFPPNDSDAWDTTAPSSLGWCQDNIENLYDFLGSNNTKAFILLKDGNIVLEQYFDDHTQSSNWYWASAGKTLTSFMIGVAQQEEYLSLSDTTSTYLGQGWTDCTPAQEDKMTIRHQLTMTTGLDDGAADPFCTLDTCLQYLSEPGIRWAYHNAPYTLLDKVIENATGQTLNLYTTQKLKNPTGMDGLYVNVDYNNVFFSTARSMARFGLLMLNNGNWNGNQILTDTNYFNEMVTTSQEINESYGYLWWLNGKNSFMLPQTQVVFPGSMFPNAPADMIAALGKNGQFINVTPSQNMVWIRMGNAPDNALVSPTLNDEIWGYINDLDCITSSTEPRDGGGTKYHIYPNPTKEFVFIDSNENNSTIEFKLYNQMGQLLIQDQYNDKVDLSDFPAGVYFLNVSDGTHQEIVKVVKE